MAHTGTTVTAAGTRRGSLPSAVTLVKTLAPRTFQPEEGRVYSTARSPRRKQSRQIASSGPSQRSSTSGRAAPSPPLSQTQSPAPPHPTLSPRGGRG
jgi:hypothetical protein